MAASEAGNRFATLNEEDLENLLESTSSENSKNAIAYSVRILTDFCESKSLNLEVATSKTDFNQILKNFFASAWTHKMNCIAKNLCCRSDMGFRNITRKTVSLTSLLIPTSKKPIKCSQLCWCK